ncbi:hypothetical protein PMJ11TS3_14130 [Paenibacillus melissococcoides]
MLRLRLRAEQDVHIGLDLFNQEALIQMAARVNRELVVRMLPPFLPNDSATLSKPSTIIPFPFRV